MFFSAVAHCAMARILVSSPQQFLSVDVGSVISDRRVIGHGYSTVPSKSRTQLFNCASEKPLVRLPHCATAQTHLRLAHRRFAHNGQNTHSAPGGKLYNSVVRQLAHYVELKDVSAQVYHSDVSGQSRCPWDEPNHVQNESGTMCLFIVDDNGEDPMRIQGSQFGQAPSSPSLDDHVLQVARGDPGAVHRAVQT